MTDIDIDLTPPRGSSHASGPEPDGRSSSHVDAALTAVRDHTQGLDPIKGDDKGPVEREFTVARRSQGRLVLRRFLQHKVAMVSLVIFVALVLVAYIGQHLYKYKYNQDPSTAYDVSVPPFTKGHYFGTDALGLDLFAEILRGITTSIEVGFIVAILCTGFGTVYGAIAGYFGGAVDNTLMRIVDLVLTLPALAVLLLLSTKFANGGSALSVALVLSALSWASISRVIRGVFLSLREKEFIEAARALGASNSRIIFRHLLPNALGPIIVNGTIFVALAILTEAGLSFLGFGIKFPDISLGQLIEKGITAADTRPWLFYFPGATLVILAICINFIGDGLRDALDPQQRVRA